MRLAPRLVLAFGFVATLSVAGLGYFLRENRQTQETQRFRAEVDDACRQVTKEIERQAESDRKLVAGSCKPGELADFTLVRLERDTFDMDRIAVHERVRLTRDAFELDELMLATNTGDVLGADPPALLTTPRADVVAGLRGDPAHYLLRTGSEPALVVHCSRRGATGSVVGLMGRRNLRPVLERLGQALHVSLTIGPPPPANDVTRATCPVSDTAGNALPLVVTKSNTALYQSLREIDETVLYAGLASTGIALILAALLARNLGRPIADLAAEARKVATGEARPLRVRGGGEIGDLVAAFDHMLEDLAATRRRLAATSRIAAWREVARRVAHEVKNPLAPIRAAVETLRRLRAREDPRFDEYFDEATRTVLHEVHRISNIVTEFTRFARLPPPDPRECDLMEVTRHVVQLQKANAGSTQIELVVRRVPPLVLADRDQIIQVLTNLVQNGVEAVAGREGGEVLVTLDVPDAGHVAVTVEDNGPGIAPGMTSRLFEPYATTKAHGTGLGLAIAQRIAIEHNGELSSLTGRTDGGHRRGAAFRLVLPVEGPPPVSDASPSLSPPPVL